MLLNLHHFKQLNMKAIKHWHEAKKLNSKLNDNNANSIESDYIRAVRTFEKAVKENKINELSQTLNQSFGDN